MNGLPNHLIKNNTNTGYGEAFELYKIQNAERERISADMHDELGSGITAIRLMSETAKKKIKENIPAELEKIACIANDLLNNMNALIWSMQPGQDKAESLVLYLKNWSYDFFEHTGINFNVYVNGPIPARFIPGTTRRNIFLAVKEALTNILKHAGATEACLQVSFEPVFKIRVSDNGRGIDLDQPRPYKQGIKNMKWRMKLCAGTCSIENNNGTVIDFSLPDFYMPLTTNSAIPG